MQIDPFVFHRFPQALDEHIVPPGTAPVHTELAPLFLDGLHELMLFRYVLKSNIWRIHPRRVKTGEFALRQLFEEMLDTDPSTDRRSV